MSGEQQAIDLVEEGANGRIHRFVTVFVPPEYGHSYLRCLSCQLSKHLPSHNKATCELCNPVDLAPLAQPPITEEWKAHVATREIMDHFLTVEIDELPDSRTIQAIISKHLAASPQPPSPQISHCALCEDPNFIYRDCVLAAQQLQREVDAGWQPIETAPKDGTSFLVAGANGQIDRAFFLEPPCGNESSALLIVGGRYDPVGWQPLPPAIRAAKQQ